MPMPKHHETIWNDYWNGNVPLSIPNRLLEPQPRYLLIIPED